MAPSFFVVGRNTEAAIFWGCRPGAGWQPGEQVMTPSPLLRGVRPPYLGHGLRQPNSVPKFGASVRVVDPYGWLRKAPTCARVALSEAESAEIVAGQIRFLPDN